MTRKKQKTTIYENDGKKGLMDSLLVLRKRLKLVAGSDVPLRSSSAWAPELWLYSELDQAVFTGAVPEEG